MVKLVQDLAPTNVLVAGQNLPIGDDYKITKGNANKMFPHQII